MIPFETMEFEKTENLNATPMGKHFIFQFIDNETGQRSEPFSGDWDTVQKVLGHRKEGERPNDLDYVLLVAVLDGKDTTIPGTPLITVKTFMEFKKPENSLGDNCIRPETYRES